jgi:hypothetical protein
VAAQEEEQEGVVAVGQLRSGGWFENGDGLLASTPGARDAALVDQAPRGDGHEPRTRVVRKTVLRPLQRRGEQGLLDGVLTRVEVPVSPNERSEDLRRVLAQKVLDAGVDPHISDGASMSSQLPVVTWRTSNGLWTNATHREAISMARSLASTIQ